jgi:hypothetical protein
MDVPLGKPGRKWEVKIKVHLKEIGREGVDWTYLTEESDERRQFFNATINLRFL